MALGYPANTASVPSSGVNVSVKFVGSGSAEEAIGTAVTVAIAAARMVIVGNFMFLLWWVIGSVR